MTVILEPPGCCTGQLETVQPPAADLCCPKMVMLLLRVHMGPFSILHHAQNPLPLHHISREWQGPSQCPRVEKPHQAVIVRYLGWNGTRVACSDKGQFSQNVLYQNGIENRIPVVELIYNQLADLLECYPLLRTLGLIFCLILLNLNHFCIIAISVFNSLGDQSEIANRSLKHCWLPKFLKPPAKVGLSKILSRPKQTIKKN